MRWTLQSFAFLALALTACGPPPKALREDVRQLRSLAEQAGKEHAELCKVPDSPAAMSPPPPGQGEAPKRCEPLLSCIDATKDGAAHCVKAIGEAGEASYSAAARSCRAQRDDALSRCAALGYVPKAEATHGAR